jgi:hypothetical protein
VMTMEETLNEGRDRPKLGKTSGPTEPVKKKRGGGVDAMSSYEAADESDESEEVRRCGYGHTPTARTHSTHSQHALTHPPSLSALLFHFLHSHTDPTPRVGRRGRIEHAPCAESKQAGSLCCLRLVPAS